MIWASKWSQMDIETLKWYLGVMRGLFTSWSWYQRAFRWHQSCITFHKSSRHLDISYTLPWDVRARNKFSHFDFCPQNFSKFFFSTTNFNHNSQISLCEFFIFLQKFYIFFYFSRLSLHQIVNLLKNEFLCYLWELRVTNLSNVPVSNSRRQWRQFQLVVFFYSLAGWSVHHVMVNKEL